MVAVGPRSNHYEWAVVSGGQPTQRVSNTTCTTRQTGVNGSGLWIFSRNRTMSNSTLSLVYEVMHDKGLSTSLLHNVTQVGCNYTGAVLK